MKFKFYPFESKLYDFIHFPGLVFTKIRLDKSGLEYGSKEIPLEGYIDFINMAEEKLKPFLKDIELFYSEQFGNNFDFIELISDVYTIIGHNNEHDYLNMLVSLNNDEITSCISYSILASGEDKNFSDEIFNKAKSLTHSELLTLIKELPIEPATKWNLFLIIEEPMKYMKMYVNLMYSLLPIFEEIYSSYEYEVKNCGQHLENFLNKNKAEGLKEISNSILDGDIIKDEENILLISAIEQYAIMLSGARKVNYLVWGLKTEEYFKKLKELNENKTTERVQIFKNLGDKTRYEVLKLLAMGETSTKEIAKALGVSSATISYHLSNLLQAKVIKPGIANDKYNYIINYSFLEEILNDFKEDMIFPNSQSDIN